MGKLTFCRIFTGNLNIKREVRAELWYTVFREAVSDDLDRAALRGVVTFVLLDAFYVGRQHW